MQRLSLTFSVLALVVSLTLGGAYARSHFITGGQIKNGTITAKDLHRNSVKSSDIRTAAVQTSDIEPEAVSTETIEPGAVEPEQLTLPPPGQLVVAEKKQGPVNTEGFTKLADAGSYTNAATNGTSLQVTWSGAVASGEGTNCVFQLRVNGQTPVNGGGEVFSLGQPVNVSTTALYKALPNGPVNVEVWAKASANITTPTCIIDPTNPGIANTFVAAEIVE